MYFTQLEGLAAHSVPIRRKQPAQLGAPNPPILRNCRRKYANFARFLPFFQGFLRDFAQLLDKPTSGTRARNPVELSNRWRTRAAGHGRLIPLIGETLQNLTFLFHTRVLPFLRYPERLILSRSPPLFQKAAARLQTVHGGSCK